MTASPSAIASATIRSLSTRASCWALATSSSTSTTRSAADDSVLRLELVDLALRLTQQRRRPLLGLGHDARRLFVGVAQDLRAVLAQRRRQGGLVDHGVGRPLLGLGQRGPQLLLALLERLEAPGHRLEVGPHLVGVEAPPDDGEGVAGDVPGRDPGRGDGGTAFWHGQSLRRRLGRHGLASVGTLPPRRLRMRSTWSRLLTA